ncbi:MAG TPA: hypothetical protein PKK82_00405 [Anaerolineaceae bacterium]|nr:hypothetical protein [Chloroflexota bacterium]HNY83289.1 hypothetical protein [Anaerolineaceae bacterium]
MMFPYRKNSHLKGYKYNQLGTYFITICTKNREKLLGEIIKEPDDLTLPKVKLNPISEVIEKFISSIEDTYENVIVDQHVVMPNHLHLLISLRDEKIQVLVIVRILKTLATKSLGFSIWQTSFYDYIIRSDEDFRNAWEYIEMNPARRENDDYY